MKELAIKGTRFIKDIDWQIKIRERMDEYRNNYNAPLTHIVMSKQIAQYIITYYSSINLKESSLEKYLGAKVIVIECGNENYFQVGLLV